jgi:ligand-binding SRPBCC domain-containing protein
MIKINRYSGVTVLESETEINADLGVVWDFFSSPHNLGKITPPEMNFVITGTDTGRKSYAGQLITYSVTPFPGIRMTWITEITHLVNYEFFTDEQRFGPYKFWHHRHFFRRDGDKTIMNDMVTFKVPGWLPGRIIGRLIIEPRVKEIFIYREKMINEIFGNSNLQ